MRAAVRPAVGRREPEREGRELRQQALNRLRYLKDTATAEIALAVATATKDAKAKLKTAQAAASGVAKKHLDAAKAAEGTPRLSPSSSVVTLKTPGCDASSR